MSTLGKLVRDPDHPTMWRVRLPDGTLSDMVNRQRASELSRLLVLEEQRKQPKGGRTAA
jgi:hypothetical protein